MNTGGYDELRDDPDESRSDLDQYHIVPVNDHREHEASPACWCKPIRDESDPLVWLHNAADGRGQYEPGRLL